MSRGGTERKRRRTESDRRTFSILTMIANEVDEDIVMSAEVPSDFESKKLPFLDTQMWMEEDRGKRHGPK